MADNASIEGIELTIKEDSTAAVASIDKLSKSLQALKTATSGSTTGLSRIATSITAISNSLNTLNGSSVAKITQLGTSLNRLSSIKVSSSLASQMTKLNTAISTLDVSKFSEIGRLADSLRPLSELGRAQLTSFIRQLGQLPELVERLDQVDMQRFATQMQAVSNALSPLANQMNRVGRSFSTLPGNIYTASRAAETSQQSFSGLLQTFRRFRGGILAVGYTLKHFGEVLGGFIDESNQYQEALNLFNSTMGESGQTAQRTAEELGNALGIDPKQFMELQGVFQLLITGFDVADDKARIMSQNLTQLSFDYASLMNTNVTEAFNKLNSAMTGQIKGLKEYGISLSVANMQEWLTTKGIDAKISKLTEAQKTYIRYNMILEKSNNAQGDMSRTLEAPANQIRVLQAQLTLLARSIGNIFIPILVKTLPYVIAMVKALKMFADAIAKFMGFKLIDVDYSTLDNTSIGISNISDGLESAAENAKEVKRYLAGFDELNVIPAPSKSSSGSGLGAGLPEDLGLGVPTYDMLEGLTADISAKSEKLVGKMKTLLGVVAAIGLGIGTWKIAKALKPLGDGVLNAMKLAENVTGISLGTANIGKTLLPIAGKVAIIVGVVVALGAAIKNAYENNETFKNGVDVLVSFTVKVFEKLKTAIQSVSLKFAELLPEPVREKIQEFFDNANKNWGTAILSVIPGINVLFGAVTSLGENFEQSGMSVDEFTDSMMVTLSDALSVIPKKIGEFTSSVSTKFSTIKSNIVGTFSGLKTDITTKLTDIKTWISNWVQKIKDLFKFDIHIKTPHLSWGYSNSQATGTIKTVLETLGLPTSMPKLNVSWYAQGGYPDMGEMFVARERGPELVGRIGSKTAVMNNDQIITGVANGVYDGVVRAMAGGSNQPVVVNISLDGNRIGQATADWNNALVRQGKPSPFLV